MNKKAKIIISLLLGIVTLNGVVSNKIFAKRMLDEAGSQRKPGMAGVSCYLVGPPPVVVVPKKEEIISQIKQLDTLYAENKINSETYNLRKKELQEQLKRIESTDDGIDENSIEDLNMGLKRIRYQYKMKKLTPEMYNDKRKFYLERIAYLEDRTLQRIDKKIARSKEYFEKGKITSEVHNLNLQIYEQEKIYNERHGNINIQDPEMEEIRSLRQNQEIDSGEYKKRKLSVLKRINLADSKKEKSK